MLEKWRYNRALEASRKYPNSELRHVFLEQELLTQSALNNLGVKGAETPPSRVAKVGRMLMAPETIPDLRVPYAVEVLGMPDAGKSTMINRYLQELWARNERYKLALVPEGARNVKDKFGDLRYTDPFTYSTLGGTATFMGYISSLENLNSGLRMVVSDRGQVDRRIFRRALFSRGDVSPEIMTDEQEYICGLENTPIQVGGMIMLMIRPSEAMRRDPKPGPVKNPDFLSRIYEQYWRLHWDILQGDIPFRIYTCINAEESQEEVYERFKYAMDTTMNIHATYLMALAQAFPNEFDKASAEAKSKAGQQSEAERLLGEKFGGRVKIVGGDDMQSEDEILQNPVIEGYKLRKRK